MQCAQQEGWAACEQECLTSETSAKAGQYLSRTSHPNAFNKLGFPGGSVKNLPAMQEIQVRSLGWEDPLDKEMATHSSILAWRIHGQRSLAGYSSWGRKDSDTNQTTYTFTLSFSKLIEPTNIHYLSRFLGVRNLEKLNKVVLTWVFFLCSYT